jgi:hypothetical protein
MTNTLKKIPYSISSYKTIRRENYYYVDKTRYLPQLEGAGKFLFLIRPRRFGKSSLLTVLECYYDIARKDEFDFLFKGTYIDAHPTPEKNAHLILKFNFSQVNPDPGKTEKSFQEHTDTCFYFFGEKYRDFLDAPYFSMMAQHEEAHHKLEFLLNYAGSKGLSVYVLIDEYDNFANTILSTAGQDAYHEMTHGAGFLRFFFNVLKGATDQVDAGIARMFITGVSPVTMDDVTSGFNIGQNITLSPEFNELLGFTQQDVRDLLTYYGVPESRLDDTLDLMAEWYGNYRFSDGSAKPLFNTNMALYFAQHFIKSNEPPERMIDQNVRIDYTKLRHLIVLDRRLNGNFRRLANIIETEGESMVRIAESFPVERLLKPSNFISLLFFFGLLSHAPDGRLRIPNRTVRQLMYSYIREGYEDVDVFSVDLWRFANLVRDMAFKGQWAPAIRFLADEVEKQTSIRDYLTGEKVIQTFLLAYLNVTDFYLSRSEEEMSKGFADIYLEPFTAKYPDVKYGWLIEIKYMKRNEYSEEKQKTLLAEAHRQLAQYAADERVARRKQGTILKGLALVFRGWEMVAAEEAAP